MAEDLSALISTRICHDLINPLGAISNGMELLTAISGQSGPEIELVAESAERATAKLNYLRIAFGNTENQSDVKGAMLQDIVQKMFTVGRFKVVWPQEVRAMRRCDAKLILLLIMAAESSAPLGGQCTVQVDDALSVNLTGPRIAANHADWEMACGRLGEADLSAATVHFAAIADLVRATNRTLDWEAKDDSLTARVS